MTQILDHMRSFLRYRQLKAHQDALRHHWGSELSRMEDFEQEEADSALEARIRQQMERERNMVFDQALRTGVLNQPIYTGESEIKGMNQSPESGHKHAQVILPYYTGMHKEAFLGGIASGVKGAISGMGNTIKGTGAIFGNNKLKTISPTGSSPKQVTPPTHTTNQNINVQPPRPIAPSNNNATSNKGPNEGFPVVEPGYIRPQSGGLRGLPPINQDSLMLMEQKAVPNPNKPTLHSSPLYQAKQDQNPSPIQPNNTVQSNQPTVETPKTTGIFDALKNRVENVKSSIQGQGHTKEQAPLAGELRQRISDVKNAVVGGQSTRQQPQTITPGQAQHPNQPNQSNQSNPSNTDTKSEPGQPIQSTPLENIIGKAVESPWSTALGLGATGLGMYGLYKGLSSGANYMNQEAPTQMYGTGTYIQPGLYSNQYGVPT